MRSKLRDYCEQFAATVRPLLLRASAARAALAAATHGTPGKELEPALAGLCHDLRVLCEKVEGQEAYVLIFGPLKSGKSTLMNAVAAAYVSEVSSLPAYPCLVFVGPGARRDCVVTRYDGRTQGFADPQALGRFLAEAHGELAAAIRAAEQRGEAFEPAEHLPAAIRRIDVRVPDTELARTGAVLVDTPGLYTRMRFGYDRMTRDFRDAAACAVFVVKSDTLFLEQVFAEFHELLELFSRVFLVVNVDSHKRDVGPDGALVPSLEQSRPEAILQAFQQLAMSAPLHRAAAEGRIRMYPVDLLQSAAAVLRRRPTGETSPGFQRFRKDLTDYLGSQDYLEAFLRDSLQRASSLTGEVSALLAGEGPAALAARAREVARRLEEVQAECDLLERALQVDLRPAFARGQQHVAAEIERCARDEGQKLLRTLGASIDTWFLSGHSLQWLLHDHWQPLLCDHAAEVARAARRALEQVQQHDGGLDLPAAVAELCRRLGIDVGAVHRAAEAAIGAPPEAAAPVPVDVAAIPLRRGVLDLVALRGLDKVRLRLFGPAERPDRKIPAREKAARLGEPGRLHLHQCVTQLRAVLAPQITETLTRHYGEALRAATIGELHRRLREELPPLQASAERLLRERERLCALLGPLEALAAEAGDLAPKVPALAHTFGTPLPRVVLQPRPPERGGRGERGEDAARSRAEDRSRGRT